jgi:uncharacterized membrane protein
VFELLFKYSPWAYRAGELSFASAWPLWILYVLVAVGIAIFAFTLYRQRHLPWWRKVIVGTLQTLLLATVLVMLWQPVLLVERVRDRENVVAVVMDASASMAHGEGDKSRLQESVAALQNGPLDALRKSFGVRLFSFSGPVQTLKQLSDIPPPGSQTRIGDALNTVLQTGATTPLSGVVIISDGGENGGTLSEERLAELATFGVPVHTVGVGPEKTPNDLELDSVTLADNASPGEVLNADVSIRHSAKGKTRLRVYDGEKLLAATDITLTSDAGVTTQSIAVPAGDPGVRDLRFTLDPLPNERNTINNTRTHVMDVTPRRRNILYVEGEPRWEYKFIRRAADTDQSLRVASMVRATPNRYYRQGIEKPQELEGGFPKKVEDLFAYDAIIIGSFEATALSSEQHEALKSFVDRRGGGLLMLAGRDGLSDGGWGLVPVAQTLPAQLATTDTKSFALTSGKAVLTEYGAESPITRLDDDATKNVKAWNDLPPFGDLEPVGKLKPGAIVLLDAKAGNKEIPLLMWQHYGRGTTYLLTTGSTWRWKMRTDHNDQRHYTFWRQLMHAIAADAPPRMTLTTSSKVYNDQRRVPINAELRNEKFEPLNDATVALTVTSDDGVTQQVQMSPSGQGDGRYTASVDAASTGLYRVSMSAKAGNKDVGELQTHFRRDDGVVEHFRTQQNRPLLQRIADSTGGRYWRLDQLGDLPEAMKYSKAGIVERQTLELWNLPAFFLLLLLLKMGEWLLRLRWKTL